MVGYLLSDDLIFSSRITGVARDLGYHVTAARSAENLLLLAREQAPRCVILDLANPGLVIADLVRQLKGQAEPPFVVAYGSHVDAATLHQARQAGCDLVWPRSKFVQELPVALPGWFAGNAKAGW